MTVANIDTMCFEQTLDVLESLPPGIKYWPFKDIGIKPTREQEEVIFQITGRSYRKKYRRNLRIFILEDYFGQRYLVFQRNSKPLITFEFHGLYQYDPNGKLNEASNYRRATLMVLLNHLGSVRLKRVDYALDFEKIPEQVIDMLTRKRIPKVVGTSVYFQPNKQREAENSRLKIVAYDKTRKDRLSFLIQRLELALKSTYWTSEYINIAEIHQLIASKGKKTIERWTGLAIEVHSYALVRDARISATQKVG